MAEVNHEDDTIYRWVIHHYKFDPARRERRNVFVAAFDNERQYEAALDRLSSTIRAEIAAGERPRDEHVSGTAWEPGHLAAAALGHRVSRAIDHGVDPTPLLETGRLPHNMAVLSFSQDETAENAPSEGVLSSGADRHGEEGSPAPSE